MGFVKEEDNVPFLSFPSMFSLLLIYQRKPSTDLAPGMGLLFLLALPSAAHSIAVKAPPFA